MPCATLLPVVVWLACALQCAQVHGVPALHTIIIAGDSSEGNTGDQGPATAAAMNTPTSVAVDASGTLYVAEKGNNCVRRVSVAGIIAAFAGTGIPGHDGNGGAATSAKMDLPVGVAVHSPSGVVYVAEDGSHVVRKIAANGTISTFAGTAYFAGNSADGLQATASRLNSPRAVAVNATGVVFVADSWNHVIRSVGLDGVMRIVAGTGVDGADARMFAPALDVPLFAPSGVACGPDGSLFISDTFAHVIRRLSGGYISIIAGKGGMQRGEGPIGDGGPATAVELHTPFGIAVDSRGQVHFVDTGARRIRTILTDGTIVTTAGTGQIEYPTARTNGVSLQTPFARAYGIALDTVDSLFVADDFGNVIFKVAPVYPLALQPSIVNVSTVGNVSLTVDVLIIGSGVFNGATLTQARIGQYACATIETVNTTAAWCRQWPLGVFSNSTKYTTTLPLTYELSGYNGTVANAFGVAKPPVIITHNPTSGRASSRLLVFGYNFQMPQTVAPTLPVVTVAGVACVAVVVVAADTLLQCSLPVVLPTVIGYPRLPIVVSNGVGQRSSDSFSIVEYPTIVSASFVGATTNAVSWPSSTNAVYGASPPIVVSAGGSGILTCSLYLVSCQLPFPSPPSDVSAPQLVGTSSLAGTVSINDTTARLAFSATALCAASGTSCEVGVQCSDAQGQSATATLPTGVSIAVPQLSVQWLPHTLTGSGDAMIQPPTTLPDLVAVVNASFVDDEDSTALTLLPAAEVACAAALVPNGTLVPASTPLQQLASTALSYCSAVLSRLSTTSMTATVHSLTASACSLGGWYTIHLECVWTPTNERFRPSPVTLHVPDVVVQLLPTDGVGMPFNASMSPLLIEAYAPLFLSAQLNTMYASSSQLLAQPVTFAAANGQCQIQLTGGSSTQVRLSGESASMTWAIAVNGSATSALSVTVDGPPSSTGQLQLKCTVWGKVVSSPLLAFITTPFQVAFASSDANPNHVQVATVLPSAADAEASAADASLHLFVVEPRYVVSHAHTSLSCSIAITSVLCSPPGFTSFGSSYMPGVLAPSVIGVTTVAITALPSTVTTATLAFSEFGVKAAGGCHLNLSATCRDGAGRQNATGNTPIHVHIPLWHGVWRSSASDVAPSSLASLLPVALPVLSFELTSSPVAAAFNSTPSLAAWSCTALAVDADTVVSTTASLASFTRFALSVATSVELSPTADGGIGAACMGLDASAAVLGQRLHVHAECVWTPTNERVRLAPLPLAISSATVLLPDAQVAGLLVEAFEPFSITAQVVTSPVQVDVSSVTCRLHTVNSSAPSLQVAPQLALAVYPVNSDGSLALSTVVVEGPPQHTIFLQVQCAAWGTTISSASIRVSTREYLLSVQYNDTLRHTWPSSASQVVPLSIVTVALPARTVVTCTLGIASAGSSIDIGTAGGSICQSSPNRTDAWGVGLGLADATPALFGESSLSDSIPEAATRTVVHFTSVGVRSPGGCTLNLTLSCQDGVGRSGTSAIDIPVEIPQLRAEWAPFLTLPAGIIPSHPLPPLHVRVYTVPMALFTATVGTTSPFISCTAALFPSHMSVPTLQALSSIITATPHLVLTSGTAAGTLDVSYATWSVAIPPLPTDRCVLGSDLTLHTECTWLPTGERMRLPPISLPVIQVHLNWVGTGAYTAAPTSVIVPGYSSQSLSVTLTRGAGVYVGHIAATCSMSAVNATVRTATLQVDAWTMAFDTAVGTSTALFNYTLSAPPSTTLFVRVECVLWEQIVRTPLMRLTTAALNIFTVGAVPVTFIPSDASTPWSVSPPLTLLVTTGSNTGTGASSSTGAGDSSMSAEVSFVTDVSCTVVSATAGVQVTATAGGDSMRSIPADPTTGVVTVPRFYLPSGSDITAVVLSVSCTRPSGDVTPTLSIPLMATTLHVVACPPYPQSHAAIGEALLPFSYAIVAHVPGSGVGVGETACRAPASGNSSDGFASDPSQVPVIPAMPPITCTLVLNATATTYNDTTSIFLQHTLSAAIGVPYIVTFAQFTIVAPQGETCGINVACTLGSRTLPSWNQFSVTLAGCPAGQEVSSLTCVTCGGNAFSVGGVDGRCRRCPPIGASCVNGKLTLLPNYYRPASQVALPIGPDTELHPCYNSEACTLVSNASMVSYSCNTGYRGPLCSVCDASIAYARFGEVCRRCWSPATVRLFVSVAAIIIIALLARLALRSNTAQRAGGSSIVLRITLSYLQAVGSLRVFKAGSTLAYRDILGWTDVIATSPLSVGALQCVVRLPYLVQFIATVSLPLLAGVTVVLIFLLVATVRAATCTPRPAFAFHHWLIALQEWWSTKRQWASLLFVLFLTYMPITTAALRTLDCYSPPIDGVTYLRSDMAVECYVGQHAAARVLAYVVLVLVGFGFPCGMAWLLATATPTQLTDDAFHNTWGFLIDGYRKPLLQQTPSGPTATATHVPGLAGGKGGSTSISGRSEPVVRKQTGLSLPGKARTGRNCNDLYPTEKEAPTVAATIRNIRRGRAPVPLLSSMQPQTEALEVHRPDVCHEHSTFTDLDESAGGMGLLPPKATSSSSGNGSTGTISRVDYAGIASFKLSAQRTASSARLSEKWFLVGNSVVWWEALILLRKAGVVLLAVLVTNPYLQCVGATLWYGGFLLLQLHSKPYANPLFNWLETLSLTASVLTSIISSALLQYNVGSAADQHAPSDMAPIEWVVTILLSLLNLGALAVLVFTCLWLQCRSVASARITRKRAPLHSSCHHHDDGPITC